MGAAGEISLSSKLGQDPAQFLPTLPSQSWDFTLSLSWSDPDSQLRAGAKYLPGSSGTGLPSQSPWFLGPLCSTCSPWEAPH